MRERAPMTIAAIKTTCCIAGGGPAGMMLGFLLARAGVPVVVLEKHADFLRDFRGDTVHPSTLELMHELGLLDEFLKLPHSRVERLSGQVGDDHHRACRLQPPADALQIHRADAAMGFSRFSGRARQELSGLRSAYEDGGDRPDRGGRPRRRRARENAGRRARDPRRSHGRLRRPAFDAARARRLPGRGHRRADGRSLVPRLAARKRHERRPSAIWKPAACWSCSTATTIGSAPM